VTETAITDEAREVGFTNDMGKLLNVINFVDVDTGTGGTPLYDAIFRAVKITAQQPGRRVILLMTDGKDQGSTLATSDPIDEANRQRIPIFPIGLSTGRLDANYLQRVAVRTGGQYQSAPAPDELTQLFQNVLVQLKEQYVLTYTARAPKDGQSHTLTVQVTTSRGQNSSKLTFILGQPAAPTASAVNATPAPGATPAPSATPVPAPGGTDMMQWINENMILVIAIAAAGLLLLLMLVIAIVLVMRRKGAAQPEYEAGAYPPQSFEGATFPGAASPAVGPVSGGISSMPTVSPAGPTPSGAPTSAGTQLASATPPPVVPMAFPLSAPPAFPAAPATPKPAETPVTPPTSGGTVIIQRGPKMKLLGMLVDKKQSSKRFDINKQAVTVGRAPGNDLIVDHPTVSRQHATIKLEGEEFRLYDLGSANGTFVNDQRLRDPMVLQDGMIVRFGEAEYIFKRISLE
jgi:FHA domain/von Willebrand factor type A domain